MNAISKSIVREMKCEWFFAAHRLDKSPARLIASPLAETGTDVHRFRAEYVIHLVNAEKTDDLAWVLGWLKRNAVSEEAREMIRRDMDTFRVNPDTVFATELFLSIDGAYRPLEQATNSTPGFVSQHPEAVLSGTIDQLDLRDDVAFVNDLKTGWSTISISDQEPPLYAALVFAHFPRVRLVEFAWEFSRWGLGKAVSYTRDDLSWIHQLIASEHVRRGEIEAKHAAGAEMTINPFAGLCSFCACRCPLRVAVESGKLYMPPIQGEGDARAVAGILLNAEIVKKQAREALKLWLDEHGPLDLGGDYQLSIETKGHRSRPLKDTLAVLGFDVENFPEETPKGYINVDMLTIGGLSSYLKTKMRRQLAEECDLVSKIKPVSKVTIKKGGVPMIEDSNGAE